VRQPVVLRYVAVGLIGAAVGVVVGVFALGRVSDPAWVEATGVWLGSIATVGAIVWAVHTFQIEQVTRRESASRAAEAELEAEHEREHRLMREADLVTVVARGGGGSGLPTNHPKYPGWLVDRSSKSSTDLGNPH
jgi:hypothetical protein